MRSEAKTVDEYIASLPEGRKEAISAVRRVIVDNLPAGYEETMNWGMICYEVPLATCPDTYNGQPLMYAALASQKNHMAVYLSGIYMSEKARVDFEKAYKATGKKLDAGKSCVRFRKLDDLPVALIGKSIASVPVSALVKAADEARRGGPGKGRCGAGGKKAPAFTLPDQDGEKVRLADFEGKWLVLYFYPKDNTSGCTKEAIDFTALKRKLSSRKAVVVGVSPDSPESHRRFIEKQKLGITLLSDEKKTVMKKYGAWGMKKNYGKEYEGVIRTTVLISPEGRIAETWSKVKVRIKRKSGEVKHADVVLERLDELR